MHVNIDLLLWELLRNSAGDTQLAGADTIIMTEGTTSGTHDHGFQVAVTIVDRLLLLNTASCIIRNVMLV